MTEYVQGPERLTAIKLIEATNPILRQRARDVAQSDRPAAVIATMREVLATHYGVGLAAPQLGVDWRVFVVVDDPQPFVNPVIVERSAETDVQEEGCLSLPGIVVAVRRNLSVTIQAKGRRVRLSGMPARIAQHEIDHLDGVLITDRAVRAAAGEPSGVWEALKKCIVPLEALHADNLAGSQLIAPSLRLLIADAVEAIRAAVDGLRGAAQGGH